MQNAFSELHSFAQTAPDGQRARPVPTEVRAINLGQLAALVGCSLGDLTGGLQDAGHTALSDGRLAAPKESVTFEQVQSAVDQDDDGTGGINLAVLSIAARPSVLDDEESIPKCLIHLGSQPVIGHVLAQLHAGGVRRVVIVLGARGAAIRQAIVELPVAELLRFDFIELGEAYASGFARSLLAAREAVGKERFLLCTADHIFDKRIVRQLRSHSVLPPHLEAVGLVEADIDKVIQMLPPTAVRVRLRRRAGEGLGVGYR